MDTRDVLVVNPAGFNQVDPDYLESERRLEKWFSNNPSKTIVATGFIASTPQNIPTTLKRDGSDFSAAIMGALLRAGKVTIWTDVNGVYSADPRKGLHCPCSFCFQIFNHITLPFHGTVNTYFILIYTYHSDINILHFAL